MTSMLKINIRKIRICVLNLLFTIYLFYVRTGLNKLRIIDNEKKLNRKKEEIKSYNNDQLRDKSDKLRITSD